MHPVGNRMFGKPLIIDTGGVELGLHSDSISTNTETQQSTNIIYEYFIVDGVKVFVYEDNGSWRYVANDAIYSI